MVRYKSDINLDLTLSCGQCFRWKKIDEKWFGVVKGVEVIVFRDGESLVFENISDEEFGDIFYDYFDFGTDYENILKVLEIDKNVQNSVEKNGNLHILRQEFPETLVSFIISQCNNIPRISKIVDTLCREFGENNAFPTMDRLAGLNVEDLSVLRAGYRADYILDAAKKITKGEISEDGLRKMSTVEARKSLMNINGVGRKVADCTLLYGLHRLDVFPVDRHIKRICDRLYPDGLPVCFEDYGGLAQQYLFVEQRG